MEITYEPIESLKSQEGNAKIHTPEQIEVLTEEVVKCLKQQSQKCELNT